MSRARTHVATAGSRHRCGNCDDFRGRPARPLSGPSNSRRTSGGGPGTTSAPRARHSTPPRALRNGDVDSEDRQCVLRRGGDITCRDPALDASDIVFRSVTAVGGIRGRSPGRRSIARSPASQTDPLAQTHPTGSAYRRHRRPALLVRTAPQWPIRVLDTPPAPGADPMRRNPG